MRTLTIDLETYSGNSIKNGVHKYVDADSFEILLFAYAFDDEDVTVIDCRGNRDYMIQQGLILEAAPSDYLGLPAEVVAALYDPDVLKTAYNAAFEITCLRKYFDDLPIEQWECDMALACYNSLPPGLGLVGAAMGLAPDEQKDARGKALIRFFCSPVKPTKKNGGRTRNLPQHDPEKWEEFKSYNKQDVVTERAIRKRLLARGLCLPPAEHALWLVDRAINDRGIGIDQVLVDSAIRISEKYTSILLDKAYEITGLANPNSVPQLKKWLAMNGCQVESLDKESLGTLLADKELHPTLKKVLSIRQQLGKSSIKKYTAMQDTVTHDGRAHDLFRYYGASRTGRWAGRNIQLQNLPRNYLGDLDAARDTVKTGDLEYMGLLYDDIPDTLSQLIRTALVPAPGNRFIVADFSAIEARVIAWIAGEAWRLEAFKAGEDIYCASASRMFKKPVVKHGVNGELRQKGKIAELALGYGGGIGALKAMGGDQLNMNDQELQDIVDAWREASPKIPELWRAVEHAAYMAMRGREGGRFPINSFASFTRKGHDLHLHLPSGRVLTYLGVRKGENKWGNPAILYYGMDQLTHKWGKLETYGGKMTENLIQAIARDCLGAAMMRLEAAGYPIVAHIHDEVVIDMEEGKGSLDEAIAIMTKNESWNEGLPMNADGFESHYYMKD